MILSGRNPLSLSSMLFRLGRRGQSIASIELLKACGISWCLWGAYGQHNTMTTFPTSSFNVLLITLGHSWSSYLKHLAGASPQKDQNFQVTEQNGGFNLVTLFLAFFFGDVGFTKAVSIQLI